MVRILRVMTLLTTGRRRIDDIARVVGVSSRTIRRDLDALEEAHVPVIKDEWDGEHFVRVAVLACPLCQRGMQG